VEAGKSGEQEATTGGGIDQGAAHGWEEPILGRRGQGANWKWVPQRQREDGHWVEEAGSGVIEHPRVMAELAE
jgi:hypothetical protein